MTDRPPACKPPCPGPSAHITKNGHRSCNGHTKNGDHQGEACRNAPRAGQYVCNRHGGNAGQNLAKAKERILTTQVEADAKALLAHHGINGIIDPLNELARVASEVVAFKDALAARVNALNEIRYKGENAEQLRAEIGLYERALDRTGKFLEVLIRSGFEERITRVREDQAAWVIARMQAVLADLQLTDTQKAIVPGSVARHFTIIEGGVA